MFPLIVYIMYAYIYIYIFQLQYLTIITLPVKLIVIVFIISSNFCHDHVYNFNTLLFSRIFSEYKIGIANSRFLGLVSMGQHDYYIKPPLRPFCHHKNPSMADSLHVVYLHK